MQCRFGELRISEAGYGDLLSEADQAYPSYLQHFKEHLLISDRARLMAISNLQYSNENSWIWVNYLVLWIIIDPIYCYYIVIG